MKLTWSPLAVSDRESIFDYIAADNVEAAIALDDRFEQCAAMLLEHPRAGREGRVARTREIVAHRHYVIVYDFDIERVRILRILHTALQWPPTSISAKARRHKRR